MGRGRSKGGNSNKTFQGFSIIDADGKKTDYVVFNGQVEYADGRRHLLSAVGDPIEVIQQAYDMEGSSKGVIDRVNKAGIGQAKILSDKDAAKIAIASKNSREEFAQWMAVNAYKRKKGVNRHRAYWSAM